VRIIENPNFKKIWYNRKQWCILTVSYCWLSGDRFYFAASFACLCMTTADYTQHDTVTELTGINDPLPVPTSSSGRLTQTHEYGAAKLSLSQSSLLSVAIYRWLVTSSCYCCCCADTAPYSPNSTWLVTSRHVTTRYLAHAFWLMEKSWRDVRRFALVDVRVAPCLSGSTAQHARRDKRDTKQKRKCDARSLAANSGAIVFV